MVSVYPENIKILCQFIPRTSKTSEIAIIIIIINSFLPGCTCCIPLALTCYLGEFMCVVILS